MLTPEVIAKALEALLNIEKVVDRAIAELEALELEAL